MSRLSFDAIQSPHRKMLVSFENRRVLEKSYVEESGQWRWRQLWPDSFLQGSPTLTSHLPGPAPVPRLVKTLTDTPVTPIGSSSRFVLSTPPSPVWPTQVRMILVFHSRVGTVPSLRDFGKQKGPTDGIGQHAGLAMILPV